MIWLFVTAGYLILLATLAALCNRLDNDERTRFWDGFAEGHKVAAEERRLDAAYEKANITPADLKALDEWWDQFRGRRNDL